jgi:multisubunit Na+/H+ antiporter MnhB subunit
MKRLHKNVVAICAVQLTLLLACVLPAKALQLADHVQTYVSESDSTDAAWDGPSSFLLAQHREDSIIVSREASGKLKDPGKALIYALLPGLVVHGAGHFYAGDRTAGWALVGGEVFGLCLIAYALGVRSDHEPPASDMNDQAGTIGVFGTAFFVGTWIYDVIGAPLAVQRENRELLGGENVGLRFGFDHTSQSVRVQIVQRF